jgi:hypothetical protein
LGTPKAGSPFVEQSKAALLAERTVESVGWTVAEDLHADEVDAHAVTQNIFRQLPEWLDQVEERHHCEVSRCAREWSNAGRLLAAGVTEVPLTKLVG